MYLVQEIKFGETRSKSDFPIHRKSQQTTESEEATQKQEKDLEKTDADDEDEDGEDGESEETENTQNDGTVHVNKRFMLYDYCTV